MKKFLSIIIALATLLLVSCASTTPAESAEPSWITSIISTTASAQEATTAATGTVATAGTNSTTATPAATTATSSTSGGAVPVESFKPSGHGTNHYDDIETRSKVMLLNLGGVLYYYSKADGELYPFCFDPFCEHHYLRDALKCTAVMTSGRRSSGLRPFIFFINSRFYFIYMGTLYSCSEFATDKRVEIEFEHFDSVMDFNEATKNHRVGLDVSLFSDFYACGNYLFFKYIDPDGKIVWYRYDVVKRQQKKMDDDLHALEEKLGFQLVLNYIIDNYVFFYAYDADGKFVSGYVCDGNLENGVMTEEKYETWPLFNTENGLYRQDFTKYKAANAPNDTSARSSYDIIVVRPNGKVETVMSNVFTIMGGSGFKPEYINDKYIYFSQIKTEKIGYQKGSRGYQECTPSNKGTIFRYNLETGKKETFYLIYRRQTK